MRSTEKNPGKMMYRHKGFFKSASRARAAQVKLRAQGLKTQVRRYVDGYSLYVMAKHDFWKAGFIYDLKV